MQVRCKRGECVGVCVCLCVGVCVCVGGCVCVCVCTFVVEGLILVDDLQ